MLSSVAVVFWNVLYLQLKAITVTFVTFNLNYGLHTVSVGKLSALMSFFLDSSDILNLNRISDIRTPLPTATCNIGHRSKRGRASLQHPWKTDWFSSLSLSIQQQRLSVQVTVSQCQVVKLSLKLSLIFHHKKFHQNLHHCKCVTTVSRTSNFQWNADRISLNENCNSQHRSTAVSNVCRNNTARENAVEVDYITKTFSASEKSKMSLVRGQITLPSLASAMAVKAYNTHQSWRLKTTTHQPW